MGVLNELVRGWERIQENILKPIAHKVKGYGEQFQKFKEDSPRFAKVWDFLVHPTMVRIYVIAAIIAMAPFSGGFSLVFGIKIAVTFGTSLISVGAKAIQLRSLRKLKFQKFLANNIRKKYFELYKIKNENSAVFDALFSLSDKEERKPQWFRILRKDKPRISFLKALSDKPPLRTHDMNSKLESKFISFLKTMRDFSAENIAPIIITAFTSPGAVLSYIVGVVGGASFISGELNERIKIKHNGAHDKDIIRGACKMAGIPPYSSLAGLYKIHKERMAEYEVIKTICDEFDKRPEMMNVNEIQSMYKERMNMAREAMKDDRILSQPNLLRSFWHELRPWGKKDISYRVNGEDVTIEEIKQEDVVEYTKPSFIELTKSDNQYLGQLHPNHKNRGNINHNSHRSKEKI